MNKKHLFYIGIILFPFFVSHQANAQKREQHRSVTINQTVIDGKVVSADTIITYTDTTTLTIHSKEVSKELPYTKGTGVLIENIYRKLNIRQSKDGKVKLSTTVFYYGEPSLTNEQWLKKLNINMEKISMENVEKGVYITSDGINSSVGGSNLGPNSYQLYADAQQVHSFSAPASPKPPVATAPENIITQKRAYQQSTLNGTTLTQNGAMKRVINGPGSINGNNDARGYSSIGTNTAVFDKEGNLVYRSNSIHRELTIYIPDGAELEIRSKYGDIVIDYDVANIKAFVNNASLDMLNAKNLKVSGGYGNISAKNVEEAKIELNNGKFSIKDVGNLIANTRYTKVEADNISTLKLQSVSDDYDLNTAKNISGTKNYGNLRIEKLTGSFDLKGSSADVKIRNIEPSVSAITVENKYADLRFPVALLKNYEVDFSGNYSSVFAPFERMEDTAQNRTTQSSNGNTSYSISNGTSVTNSSFPSRNRTTGFTASVGDVKGTHTAFKLNCTSCQVSFR